MRNVWALAAGLILSPLVLAGGCRSGEAGDPPLELVPLTRGSASAEGQAGPTERTPRDLPPNHPPVDGAMPREAGPLPPGAGMGNLPPDHPPLSGTTGAAPFANGGAPFAGPPAGAGSLRWTTPGTWTEEAPSSSMRIAQWRLGASQPTGPGECALLRFSGGGGSVEDNINRWIGQFTQPDGASSTERAVRGQELVNGLRVDTLSLTGTMQTRNPAMSGPVVDMPGYAMYGAIVETDEGPYFLKCTGPEATLDSESGGIHALVGSFASQ